jgi:WD40 repeat protein
VTLPVGHSSMGLAFTPDGASIASAGVQDVSLYDTSTGALTRTHGKREGPFQSIAFSPDGSWYVTGPLGDGAVVVRDTETGERVHELQPYPGWGDVFVSVSPDGVIAGGDRFGAIRLWDVNTGTELRTMRGYGEGIADIAVSHASRRILVAGMVGTVSLWEGNEQQTRYSVLGAHKRQATGAGISPDGTSAITSALVSGKRWDLSTNPPTGIDLDGARGARGGVAFSPDGRRAAATGPKGFTVWDTATWTVVATGAPTTSPYQLRFTVDGAHIAASPPSLYEADSGKKVRDLAAFNGAQHVAVMPDGENVLYGDGANLYVTPVSGDPVRSSMKHADWTLTWSMGLAPDGKTAVTGSMRGRLASWDLAATALVEQWVAHSAPVGDIEWAGDTVLSASDDKTIKLWKADGTLVATLLSEPGGAWVVVAGDGRVEGGAPDGSDVVAHELVYWQVGDDVYLPGFVGWQRYESSGLLAEFLRTGG